MMGKLTKVCPPIPWIVSSEISFADRGRPLWYITVNWRHYSVTRWGRTRLRARVNAVVAVFFYRLLMPLRKRWIAQNRGVYPRWYDWLTRW